MSNLFNNILKNEESLLINPIALDYDYQPKLIPFRENQQHHIATCIKPLFNNRNGKNLLITGKPGIGKTVCIKHVLRELEEKTGDIIPLYINCWKKDTPYKIVIEICEQIGYKWIQNRKTDELLKKITGILNKKTTVIVMDEIDKLEDLSIIYSLLEDIYKKTTILITNEREWITTLDPRLKSRLTLESIEFKPYNLKETEGILKQRIGYAFPRNVMESDALNAITEKTFELEDIRTGLFLLKESTSIAESESSKKITSKHANDAIKKLNNFTINKPENFHGDEKEILELIKQNSGKTTMELYELYKKSNKEKTYRTFYRKVKLLADGKLITLREINRGVKGKSTIVEFGALKGLNEF